MTSSIHHPIRYVATVLLVGYTMALWIQVMITRLPAYVGLAVVATLLLAVVAVRVIEEA